MNEDLTQEPAARLLEVLLEERFRKARTAVARRVAQRHVSRWLAAALVVLGLGVVFGVVKLRSVAEPVVAPTQDPQPDPAPWLENMVRVSTYADFLARIAQAQRVGLQLVRPTADGKGLVPLANATAALEGERLRAFLAAVPRSGDNLPGLREPSSFAACLSFELRDGKQVVCFVHFGDQPLFAPQALLPRSLAAGPFLTALNDLHLQAITKARIASGSTYSLDELQQVPVNTKTITCRPLPPGSVARHLGRFTQLERLELAFQTSLGATGPITIELPAPVHLAEYAALPRLRHLRCPGNGLTDADAAAVATSPLLTSLRIDGGLGDLTAPGRRALVQRLEAIELFDVVDPDAMLQAVVDAGIARHVVLQCRGLRPETFVSLVAMPTLTDLELGGIWCTDEHLIHLVSTPLVRLSLQNTRVTAAGLTTLAIHTLRELCLSPCVLDAATAQALTATMPRCRIRRPGEVDEPLPVPAGDPGTTRK